MLLLLCPPWIGLLDITGYLIIWRMKILHFVCKTSTVWLQQTWQHYVLGGSVVTVAGICNSVGGGVLFDIPPRCRWRWLVQYAPCIADQSSVPFPSPHALSQRTRQPPPPLLIINVRLMYTSDIDDIGACWNIDESALASRWCRCCKNRIRRPRRRWWRHCGARKTAAVNSDVKNGGKPATDSS